MQASAWSNGGYSDDPSNPDYGTHDWIAEHALDWLPAIEKEYITSNLVAYLYGTELPDNPNPEDGIGDTTKHHIYFDSTGTLMDDSAAIRAQEEYDKAIGYLNTNNLANAAKTAGIMSHYVADMAVFGHVMSSGTDWGAEVHHDDYESYVNTRTNSYNDDFNIYLSFDGSLNIILAYDSAINLAYGTTFDVDGNLTCVWMDNNYDWSNLTFKDRCGESLNLAVNYLTDILHTLYVESGQDNSTPHVVINEVELNPPGNDNYLNVEEWVELYNPTTNDVDISGWKTSTTHGTTITITIPQGTTIPANGYYVYGRGSQWLDNDDESIVLKDFEGTEVDRTPMISDNDNDDRSWQRYPNGQDFWHFRSSTKGSSNGGDTTPPNITDMSQIPLESNVLPENEVEVNATVTDDLSGVKQVALNYTNGNGTWIAVDMTNLEGNVWSATIPAFPYCTNVTYVIIAEDNANNTITTEDMGYEYQYHVIPEFPSLKILLLFMIATLMAVAVYRRKLKDFNSARVY